MKKLMGAVVFSVLIGGFAIGNAHAGTYGDGARPGSERRGERTEVVFQGNGKRCVAQ
ncbi:MAG: hypothetical protein M0024_05020 [Nitrospiraceae bacterium]|nr:hypothetical protein [Nitrospiraceae bacterium]